LKDGAIKNNEPNDDNSGYIATPENHQPQIDVSAEQERALDECLKKEKEKLQGATDNAASRTGYTTVSGLYQPKNKILAVQERAMDECLKKAKAKLR
jgi:hypothetical protein